MNRERLNIQIDVLRQVEAEHFHMDTWADQHGPCGTTCCALGWAALDPRLQAEGLRLFVRMSGTGEEIEVKTVAEFNANDEMVAVFPEFDNETDFYAAASFFEITKEAALFIFASSNYPIGELNSIMPGDVIAHIEQVMALNGVAPSVR